MALEASSTVRCRLNGMLKHQNTSLQKWKAMKCLQNLITKVIFNSHKKPWKIRLLTKKQLEQLSNVNKRKEHSIDLISDVWRTICEIKQELEFINIFFNEEIFSGP